MESHRKNLEQINIPAHYLSGLLDMYPEIAEYFTERFPQFKDGGIDPETVSCRDFMRQLFLLSSVIFKNVSLNKNLTEDDELTDTDRSLFLNFGELKRVLPAALEYAVWGESGASLSNELKLHVSLRKVFSNERGKYHLRQSSVIDILDCSIECDEKWVYYNFRSLPSIFHLPDSTQFIKLCVSKDSHSRCLVSLEFVGDNTDDQSDSDANPELRLHKGLPECVKGIVSEFLTKLSSLDQDLNSALRDAGSFTDIPLSELNLISSIQSRLDTVLTASYSNVYQSLFELQGKIFSLGIKDNRLSIAYIKEVKEGENSLRNPDEVINPSFSLEIDMEACTIRQHIGVLSEKISYDELDQVMRSLLGRLKSADNVSTKDSLYQELYAICNDPFLNFRDNFKLVIGRHAEYHNEKRLSMQRLRRRMLRTDRPGFDDPKSKARYSLSAITDFTFSADGESSPVLQAERLIVGINDDYFTEKEGRLHQDKLPTLQDPRMHAQRIFDPQTGAWYSQTGARSIFSPDQIKRHSLKTLHRLDLLPPFTKEEDIQVVDFEEEGDAILLALLKNIQSTVAGLESELAEFLCGLSQTDPSVIPQGFVTAPFDSYGGRLVSDADNSHYAIDQVRVNGRVTHRYLAHTRPDYDLLDSESPSNEALTLGCLIPAQVNDTLKISTDELSKKVVITLPNLFELSPNPIDGNTFSDCFMKMWVLCLKAKDKIVYPTEYSSLSDNLNQLMALSAAKIDVVLQKNEQGEVSVHSLKLYKPSEPEIFVMMESQFSGYRLKYFENGCCYVTRESIDYWNHELHIVD
jgi:hypothetical protein